MKPFAQQTYYELLEVPPSASDDDIRAAHQRLMELYSPDSIAVYALGDPEQVDALREKMTEAMEMLTDADLRVEYDRSLGLSTERLAKATVASGAVEKADSAARVAEALATAAAALAKAAGAVDAERVEAESRLKAVASVNEEEAPRASGTPGKSEERMRGEESKRQEAPGEDASGVTPEPVMVGGVAVVDAFRASFTRSLSFVYVPAGPLRGQGRGASAPVPVETSPRASSQADAVLASEAPAANAVEAAPAVASIEAGSAAASKPDDSGSDRTDAAASTPGASGSERAGAAASTPAAPEPLREHAPAAPTSEQADGAVSSAAGSTADHPEAAVPVTTASASDPAVASATPVSDRPEAPATADASSVAPVTPPNSGTPTEASATPASTDSTQPETPAGDSAPIAASAPGESDPNPVPDARAPSTPDATPEVSSTALSRTPATGASRAAVRPLTARPIDARPSANTRPVPGAKIPVPRKLGEAQVLAQDAAIATAESALAQVAARVKEARPRGVDIPADAEFNGELLRRVREARSLSIQQLADRTRISVRHLENVEADRYTALPPPVYLRGILMNLARELGLDPLRVSKSYLALFSEKPPKSGR
ncbi:molecular chaperone DnaJ [Corallococcus praedator]|uniref:Molecular chaperone DnaJ n=1 Tax=Corallococcus praedator TaxID=2316724 RepID=A0ABX9QLI3_9BACT|nr:MULTISPECIES: helix-turn-helix domain-containing protein [Corallococcus]RKH31843.1 molecular chaperone DnaJ [Corallococcus sp. CA031C]RKI11614.1 molecular chaperone DnaJ [Corallococcus praedator]